MAQYRDERLCPSTSARPYTLWRPSGSWTHRPGYEPRLGYRAACVDAAGIKAEEARCARYDADTDEHRLQCGTAGCGVRHRRCVPHSPSTEAPTPHEGALALCVQHKDAAACEAEGGHRCRFDHGMVCVPNAVPAVPLHMRREVRRAPRPLAPEVQARRQRPRFRRGQRVQVGDELMAEVLQVKEATRVPGTYVYEVRALYEQATHDDRRWVAQDQLRDVTASLQDPYA